MILRFRCDCIWCVPGKSHVILELQTQLPIDTTVGAHTPPILLKGTIMITTIQPTTTSRGTIVLLVFGITVLLAFMFTMGKATSNDGYRNNGAVGISHSSTSGNVNGTVYGTASGVSVGSSGTTLKVTVGSSGGTLKEGN